jgi:4-hydroxy-3-methylbut-2-enyl diphosphate reductase IspH
LEWFEGVQTVGLTAGTSTPDAVIAEIEARLETIAQQKSLALPAMA